MLSKHNIFLYTGGFGYPFRTGGAEIQAVKTAIALSRLGFRVRLVQGTPHPMRLTIRVNERLEIIYEPLTLLRGFKPASNLPLAFHTLRANPFAVIGFDLATSCIVACSRATRRLVRFAGLDTCLLLDAHGLTELASRICLGGSVSRLRDRLYTRVYAKCLMRCEGCEVLALNRLHAVILEKLLSRPIHVVHNFAEDRFFEVGVRKLKKPRRGRVAGYIGRLSFEKGADMLPEIIEHVLRECRDCRFLVVGDGPFRGRLRRLERIYGNRLDVRGFVPHSLVHRVFEEVDVLVVPSRVEGSPNTVIQAMAAATPVAASNIPPLAEHIGGCGLLAEPDPASIAEATLRLLTDERLRGKLAACAYSLALRRYTVEAYAARLLEAILGSVPHS